jgi:hypothetical protein
MAEKIALGAPSITGQDCNDLIEEAFGAEKFPLKIRVQNFAPRNFSFPQLGLFVKHAAAKDGTAATVQAPDLETLQRFASDVEQLSELNGYEKAVEVSKAASAGRPPKETAVVTETKAAAAPAAVGKSSVK